MHFVKECIGHLWLNQQIMLSYYIYLFIFWWLPVLYAIALKNSLYGVKAGSQPIEYRVIAFSAILPTTSTGSIPSGQPL